MLLLAGCAGRTDTPAALSRALAPGAGPAVLVSAHRGAPAPGRAENGLCALWTAARRGADLVECDVRRTGDGELVLLHDEDLERTTTGRGPVAALTRARRLALRLKDGAGGPTGEPLPRLDDALGLARRGVVLALDPKPGVGRAELADRIRRAGAAGRVVILADDVADLAAWGAVAPDLVYSGTARDLAEARRWAAAARGLRCPLAFTGRGPPAPELAAFLRAHGARAVFLDGPGPAPRGSVRVVDRLPGEAARAPEPARGRPALR